MARRKQEAPAAPEAPARWKNRIVGHGLVDPRLVKMHALNPRTHGDVQRAALRGALDELGWIGEVRINRTTGNLIDGHARIKEALDANENEVPVTYLELTEEEERLALATYDAIGAQAGYDAEVLTRLVSMVNVDNAALVGLLADLQASNVTLPPPLGVDGVIGNTGEHGDNDRTFWPSIEVQVPADTLAKWHETLALFDGEPHEQIAALLAKVQ